MKNPLFMTTDGYGGRGGIAQYNRNLIQAISENDEVKRVTILQRKIFYKLEDIPKKVKLVRDSHNSKLKFFRSILGFLLKNETFDVIFCCHIHLMPFAWILSKKFKCPIVLTIFGEEAWKPTKHILANYLCKKINYLITIRHYTAKKFLKWSKNKNINYFYIPNTIDQDKFMKIANPTKLKKKHKLKEKKIIISCGRMDVEDKNKGMDEIIEILSAVSKKIKNIYYVIIGDGDDKARLEHKAKRLKVDNLILFLGNVPEKIKIQIYSIGHVMAMPGSRKTFDRYPFRFVNLEGLASGMHVLCSKLKYKSDMSDRNIKMLTQVNPNNKKEIIKKLTFLLKKKKHNYNLNSLNYLNFKKKVGNLMRNIN